MPIRPEDLAALQTALAAARQQQQRESDWTPTVIRIGVPAATGVGLGLYSFITGGLGTPLALAAGGASAGLGEQLAQEYERATYGAERHPLQTLVQTGVGAVPLGKVGSLTSAIGKNALLGGTATAASRLVEGQTPSLQDIGVGAATGGAVGGAFHAALSPFFHFLANRAGFESPGARANRYTQLGTDVEPPPPPVPPGPEYSYPRPPEPTDYDLTNLGVVERPEILRNGPASGSGVPPVPPTSPFDHGQGTPFGEGDWRAVNDVAAQAQFDRDLQAAIRAARTTTPLWERPEPTPPTVAGPLVAGREPARILTPDEARGAEDLSSWLEGQPTPGSFLEYARRDADIRQAIREAQQLQAARDASNAQFNVETDPSRLLPGAVDSGSAWERAWGITGGPPPNPSGPGPLPATRFWQGQAGTVDATQPPFERATLPPEGSAAGTPVMRTPPPLVGEPVDRVTGGRPGRVEGWENIEPPLGTRPNLGDLIGLPPTQAAEQGLPLPRMRENPPLEPGIPPGYVEAPAETAGYPKEASAADGYLRQYVDHLGRPPVRTAWGVVEPEAVPQALPPAPPATEGQIIQTPVVPGIDQGPRRAPAGALPPATPGRVAPGPRINLMANESRMEARAPEGEPRREPPMRINLTNWMRGAGERLQSELGQWLQGRQPSQRINLREGVQPSERRLQAHYYNPDDGNWYVADAEGNYGQRSEAIDALTKFADETGYRMRLVDTQHNAVVFETTNGEAPYNEISDALGQEASKVMGPQMPGERARPVRPVQRPSDFLDIPTWDELKNRDVPEPQEYYRIEYYDPTSDTRLQAPDTYSSMDEAYKAAQRFSPHTDPKIIPVDGSIQDSDFIDVKGWESEVEQALRAREAKYRPRAAENFGIEFDNASLGRPEMFERGFNTREEAEAYLKEYFEADENPRVVPWPKGSEPPFDQARAMEADQLAAGQPIDRLTSFQQRVAKLARRLSKGQYVEPFEGSPGHRATLWMFDQATGEYMPLAHFDDPKFARVVEREFAAETGLETDVTNRQHNVPPDWIEAIDFSDPKNAEQIAKAEAQYAREQARIQEISDYEMSRAGTQMMPGEYERATETYVPDKPVPETRPLTAEEAAAAAPELDALRRALGMGDEPPVEPPNTRVNLLADKPLSGQWREDWKTLGETTRPAAKKPEPEPPFPKARRRINLMPERRMASEFPDGPEGEPARMVLRRAESDVANATTGDSGVPGRMPPEMVKLRVEQVAASLRKTAAWARSFFQGERVPGQAAHVEAAARQLEAKAKQLEAASPDDAVRQMRDLRGQRGFGNTSALNPVAGGLVGAAIGAPVGAALDEKDRGRGAVAGAGLGALLGAAGGARVGRSVQPPPGEPTVRPAATGARPTPESETIPQPPAGKGARRIWQATEQPPIPRSKPIPEDRRVMLGMDRLRHKSPELTPIMEDELDRLFEEADAYTVARGGRQPDARTAALAARIKVDVEKKLAPRYRLNDPQTVAYASAYGYYSDKANAITQKMRSGTATDVDALEFTRALAAIENLDSAIEGSTSEAARVLRRARFLRNILPGDEAVAARAAGEAVRSPKSKPMLDLPWDDPIALRERITATRGQSAFRTSMGYYVNNILSGVLTQERNLGGNLSNLVNRLGVKAAAVAGDVAQSAATGRPRQVFAGELKEDLIGTLGAIQKAWKDAAYTMRYGHSVERIRELGDTLHSKTSVESVFEMEHRELPGGGINPMNWPSRLLDAGDRFFYQLNRGGEIHSQAYALATQRAKAAGRGGNAQWIAEEAAKLRLAMPEELSARVREEARRGVYREQVPPALAHLLALKEHVPALNMVIPFVRMPYNLMKQGLEHSPVGLVMKQGTSQRLAASLVKGAAEGEERQTAMALGRVLEGSALLTPLAFYAMSGKISGTGPSDLNKKSALMRTGWRPNSINIPLPDGVAKALGASRSDDGTYWVPYQLFQPVSQPLMALANGVELYHEGQMQDPAKMQRWGQSVALRFADSLISQSFLSGLSNLVGALEDPDQFAKQYIGGTAAGFIPLSGALTTVQRATDKTVRKTETPLDVVKSRMPGLSQTLQPRMDVYGRDIQREESAWNAMTPIGQKHDAVDAELRRLGVTLAPPADRLEFKLPRGQKTRLEDDQQQETFARAKGMADRAALVKLMQQPRYQRAPDYEKQRLVHREMQRAGRQVSDKARTALRRGQAQDLERLLTPSQREYASR